ncbi:MAG: hypothetical protein QF824_02545 [Candidatus Woesearchaeota archaeon]|jgi:hypothetical protein|nr:hypothetical protein [Candidatus Woesearchaeota archaeon]
MVDHIHVPRIGDVSQDNYAGLDHGLRTIEMGYATLRVAAIAAFSRHQEGLIGHLSEHGFRPSQDEDTVTVALEKVGLPYFPGVTHVVPVYDKREFDDARSREFDDLLTEYARAHAGDFNGVIDKGTELERAKKDYTKAVLGLTTIEALGQIDPSYDAGHIFVVTPSGVYEAHLDYGLQVSAVLKSEGLTRADFGDKTNTAEFAESGFREALGGREVNVYVARNDSTAVPYVDVAAGATVAVVKQIEEARKEAEDAKEVPERLADKVRTAFEQTRRG